MLRLHAEIIRLHSDEDQAGLFAGSLGTLSVPRERRARHAWRGGCLPPLRGDADEAWLMIKLQLSSFHFFSFFWVTAWVTVAPQPPPHPPTLGNQDELLRRAEEPRKSLWQVIWCKWRLPRRFWRKIEQWHISEGALHSQGCKRDIFYKSVSGDKLQGCVIYVEGVIHAHKNHTIPFFSLQFREKKYGGLMCTNSDLFSFWNRFKSTRMFRSPIFRAVQLLSSPHMRLIPTPTSGGQCGSLIVWRCQTNGASNFVSVWNMTRHPGHVQEYMLHPRVLVLVEFWWWWEHLLKETYCVCSVKV